MKTIVAAVLTCTLTTAIAAPAFAQAKAKKKGAGQPTAITQLNKSLEKAQLTEEQKASIKEIFARHQGPLAELQKAKLELLGEEASRKMNEARKAASAEGKKGKELQAAIQAAAGLSEEQVKQLDELQKKTMAATTALKQEVLALLTEEQKQASGISISKRAQRQATAKPKKSADN